MTTSSKQRIVKSKVNIMEQNLIALKPQIEKFLKTSEELLSLSKKTVDKPMLLKYAAEYLQKNEDFMYKLNDRKEIPYSKPGGKLVYYWKSDLDKWINKNRIASQEELEATNETSD